MKPLKRTKYWTMNSWNLSTAPAYNLKVYNVIDNDLLSKVCEMMQLEDFYIYINHLIREFDKKTDYKWQAKFNGRSGGYLVLYKGGKHKDERIYVNPGKSINIEEVPSNIRKLFRQLAIDIVKCAEYQAKHCEIREKEISTTVKIICRKKEEK